MRPSNLNRKVKAFTLIEMLLVTSLLSVTGLAIYNVIADGAKIWEYSRRYSSEEDVALFFEKLSADLQNTYQYSAISFEGKLSELSIPTIVLTPADKRVNPGKDIIAQMGSVKYSLNKTEKAIYRRQGNYSQAINKKFDKGRVLATPVEDLRFLYFIVEDGELKAKKSISKEIPAAVVVEVDFVEVTGGIRKIKRMINIPLGKVSG